MGLMKDTLHLVFGKEKKMRMVEREKADKLSYQEKDFKKLKDKIKRHMFFKGADEYVDVLNQTNNYKNNYDLDGHQLMCELETVGEELIRFVNSLMRFKIKNTLSIELKIVYDMFVSAALSKQGREKRESPFPRVIWEEQIGYKGMNKDMTCRDFQYKLGETYTMRRDEVLMCTKGFHFSKTLKGTFPFYRLGPEHRYFKVRGIVARKVIGMKDNGKLIYENEHQHFFNGDKEVACEIEILEEIYPEQMKDEISEQYPLIDNYQKEWTKEYINNYKENSIKKYGKKIAEKIGVTEQFGLFLFEKCFKNEKEYVDKIFAFIDMLVENDFDKNDISKMLLKEFEIGKREELLSDGIGNHWLQSMDTKWRK